ncbi:FkbM family methyltransferase [Aurantiacibacter spongiae]|uniref:FkbM family methyltransferase n=1 Tax=Aurantiacibacter spongiae TaxID=2488860 RepID=A0A3N5CQ99_9SPHN|nr:FkbM family methyltransferase [Aurantiacibacter spongiae]RPF70546.1 FkbM family methyltransferase [Aurantiacibacter spongiae]
MPVQSTNRYYEAALIAAGNPVAAARFAVDTLRKRRGTAHRLSFRGIPLLVRPNTPDLRVVRTCLLGEFDEVMPVVSDRHGLIIDAGGYIGLVSILLARRFPRTKIVCLEPSSENFALASRNCAPYANIEVVNAALAPVAGELTLNDRDKGQWGFTLVAESADRGKTRPIEQVQAVTVEDILARYDAQGLDLVKLDIEGGENALLQGRPEWVARADVIVTELHDRIVPGTSEVYADAMTGRIDIDIGGEKFMSIAPDAPGASHAIARRTADTQ